ncbi:hypothetical protein ACU8KI_16715 [Rhizobium leguminosarum]
MLWILKLLQRVSRYRRRFFGLKTPHWLKDGLSIGGYLNVFDLLPTLAAIALAPDHFFKRVPQIISSKFTWHKTPIKFLTSGVALIVILLVWLDAGLLEEYGLTDKTVIGRYLLGICLTAPLTIPIIAVFFRICLFFLSGLPGTSGNDTSQIAMELGIAVSAFTYVRIEYRKFLWSTFYFGVYFYISLQVFLLLSYYLWSFGDYIFEAAANAMDGCKSHVDDLVAISGQTLTLAQRAAYYARCRETVLPSANIGPSALTQIVFGGLAGITIIVGCAMMIRPYIALLRSVVTIPTKRMHRVDCMEAVAALKPFRGKGAKSKYHTTSARRLPLIAQRIESKFKAQDRQAVASGSTWRLKLRQERTATYAKMLDLPGLRDALSKYPFTDEIKENLSHFADRLEVLLEKEPNLDN